MNDSVVFGTFTVLSNHHTHILPKHFHHPQRNPHTHEAVSSHLAAAKFYTLLILSYIQTYTHTYYIHILSIKRWETNFQIYLEIKKFWTQDLMCPEDYIFIGCFFIRKKKKRNIPCFFLTFLFISLKFWLDTNLSRKRKKRYQFGAFYYAKLWCASSCKTFSH